MADHGLSERHLEIIRAVLAPYGDRIERVGLFGSRATGRAKPASDVDLVLHGAIDDTLAARIRTDFEESALPFTVDVVAFARITHPPLRAHIEAVEVALFRGTELVV